MNTKLHTYQPQAQALNEGGTPTGSGSSPVASLRPSDQGAAIPAAQCDPIAHHIPDQLGTVGDYAIAWTGTPFSPIGSITSKPFRAEIVRRYNAHTDLLGALEERVAYDADALAVDVKYRDPDTGRVPDDVRSEWECEMVRLALRHIALKEGTQAALRKAKP